MTNLNEKQAEYVSCRFVHHIIVLCGLFVCTNYSQTSSNTIHDKRAVPSSSHVPRTG